MSPLNSSHFCVLLFHFTSLSLVFARRSGRRQSMRQPVCIGEKQTERLTSDVRCCALWWRATLAAAALVAVVMPPAAAVTRTLPCGGTQLLTPQDSSNSTLVVNFCNGSTVLRLVSGGATNAVAQNVSLLVSHSVDVRVEIDSVQLVDSIITLTNVSASSACPGCSTGYILLAKHCTLVTSVVSLFDLERGLALLVSFESIVITNSFVVVRRCVVLSGVLFLPNIAVTNSSLLDSTVLLADATIIGAGALAVHLMNNFILQTRVVVRDCTIATAANVTGRVSSSFNVEGCQLQESSWTISNVSVALTAGFDSQPQHHLLMFNSSTSVRNNVTLTNIHSSNTSVLGLYGCVWAQSSLVLTTFTVETNFPVTPCITAFESTLLMDGIVFQTHGAVVTAPGAYAGLLCLALCNVTATTFWSRLIDVRGDTLSSVTVSGLTRGIFSLQQTTFQTSSLELLNVTVVDFSALLLLVAVQAFRSLFVIHESYANTRRGCLIDRCSLSLSHVVFDSSYFSADTQTVFARFSNLSATNVTVSDCVVVAAASTAWFTTDSNVSSGSAVVWRRTTASANVSTFGFQRSTLDDTTVALYECNVMSASSGAWLVVHTNVTRCRISLQRTSLFSDSSTLAFQASYLRQLQLVVEESNVSSTSHHAVIFFATYVLSGALHFYATTIASAGNAALALDASAMTGVTLALADCHVTAASTTTFFVARSNLTSSSVAIQRTSLLGESSPFMIQHSIARHTNIALRDCTVSATVSSTCYILRSQLVSSELLLINTSIHAGVSDGFRLQLSTFENSTIQFIVCALIAATSDTSWFLTDSNLTESVVALRDCQLSARMTTIVIQNVIAASSVFDLVNCTVVALADSGLNLLDSNLTDCRLTFRQCNFVAASNAIGVSAVVAVSLVLLVHDSKLTAFGAQALFLTGITANVSAIDLRNSTLMADSYAFFIQRTITNNASIALTSCHVVAGDSYAWVAYEARFDLSSLILHATRFSAASSNAFGVWASAVLSTRLMFSECRFSASASSAWHTQDTQWLGSSSVLFENTSLVASANTFFIGRAMLLGVTFDFFNCSVVAWTSVGWTAIDAVIDASRLVVRESIITSDTIAVSIDHSVILSAHIIFLVCNVVADLAAWYIEETNVTRSVLQLHRSRLTARTVTIGVVRSSFDASACEVTDCTIAVAQSGALYLLQTRFTSGVVIELHRVTLSGSANTIFVDRCLFGNVTHWELVNSSVVAAVTRALVVIDSNFTGASIHVARCRFSADTTTFTLQRIAMSAAATFSFKDSNFTALLSGGWYAASSNFSGAGGIDRVVLLFQRSWFFGGNTALTFQRSTLTLVEILFVDCAFTVNTSGGLYITDTDMTNCSVVAQRSFFASAWSCVSLQRSNVTTTEIVFSKSTIFVATRIGVSVGDAIFMTSTLRLDNGTVLERRSAAECSAVALPEFCTANSTSATTAADLSILSFSRVQMNISSVYVRGNSTVRANASLLWNISDSVLVESRVHVATSTLESYSSLGCFTLLNTVTVLFALTVSGSHVSCGGPFLQLQGFPRSIGSLSIEFNSSNFIRSHWSGEATHSNAMIAVSTSSSSSVRVVSINSSRFAGFLQLLHAANQSSPLELDVVVACSWWSYSTSWLKFLRLTKLQLGPVTLSHSPLFLIGSTELNGHCEPATTSLSFSQTQVETLSSTVSLRPSRSTSATLSISLNSTVSLCNSKSLSLLETVSGPTLQHTESTTRSLDPTPSLLPAARIAKLTKGGMTSFSALIGALIAATSPSAVGSGLAAQRVAFVIRSTTLDCSALLDADTAPDDALDWLSSPAQLSFGSAPGATHRGAVIGNAATCGVLAVCVFLVAVVKAQANTRRLVAALRSVRVHSVLWLPIALLLQPTFSFAVALLSRLAFSAVDDISIGILGFLYALGVMVTLCAVINPHYRFFRARAEHVVHRATCDQRHPLDEGRSNVETSYCRRVVSVHRQWAAASTAWRPKPGHPAFVKDWGFLFDEARANRHWWLLVDVCVSLVVGGLAAVEPGSSGSCVALKWAIVAVTCAAVVLPLVLRPLNSHRATCSCVTLASLTALIAVLGVAEADPAVIEGISILAVVLQWLPIVADTGLRKCGGSVQRCSAEAVQPATAEVVVLAVHRQEHSLKKITTSSLAPNRVSVVRVIGISHQKRQHAALQRLIQIICAREH